MHIYVYTQFLFCEVSGPSGRDAHLGLCRTRGCSTSRQLSWCGAWTGLTAPPKDCISLVFRGYRYFHIYIYTYICIDTYIFIYIYVYLYRFMYICSFLFVFISSQTTLQHYTRLHYVMLFYAKANQDSTKRTQPTWTWAMIVRTLVPRTYQNQSIPWVPIRIRAKYS